MVSEIISKPMYRILSDLTQELRVDVALNLAVKELIRLKLLEADRLQAELSTRYGMEWETFKNAWRSDQITNKHSYEVESDYWEWEASVSDSNKLKSMLETLP